MAAIMAITKPRSLQQRVVGLAGAVAVLLLLLGCRGNAAAEEQCNFEAVVGLVANCQPYVMRGGPGTPPSAACCAAMRTANLQCLCNLVKPPVAGLIDMAKVCHVARTCGVSVPPSGSKCGVDTIPKNC